eukprot:TRINITY_DN2357_c0_g1_i1.p1 TRINITY_DN2357_c0_g1~~TRINITY_DN2357_c0_g1_i1.p1  ORF type:complete len:610 (+),score=174.66 TRINITY_DN2357_c0_g1_i1:140-1969(+)
MGPPRGGAAADVVLPDQARPAPVMGPQDLEQDRARARGGAALGCVGGAGAAAAGRGGVEGGVSAVEADETTRRERVVRMEAAERLQLSRPVEDARGWRQRTQVPVDLKTQLDELAGRIRDLTRGKGRDDPDTRAAIVEMNRLRAMIPKRSAAKTKRDGDGSKGPQPKKARPSDLQSTLRQPVAVTCDTPLYLRSTVRPVSALLQRRSSCSSAAARAAAHAFLNELVVYGGRAEEMEAALASVLREAARGCDTCLWNAATYLVTAGREGEAQALLRGGVSEGARPELFLLQGMLCELRAVRGGAEGEHHGGCGEWYRKAVRADHALDNTAPLLRAYFGLRIADHPELVRAPVPPSSDAVPEGPAPLLLFTDLRIGTRTAQGGAQRTAHDMQREALLKLLRISEFGKAGFATFPPECPADRFQAELHCCVRHFLSPEVTAHLSAHYKAMITSGVVNFGDRRTERYFLYNDPVARYVMAQCTPFIARLYGAPVKPSYSYMISYRDESELLPHQDREQAEIVVTIQLDSFPSCDVWPLYIGADPQPPKRGDAEKPPEHLRRRHVLCDGDAVVFRGRRMIHWREKITPGTETSMLLIHYVDASYNGSLKQGFKD